MGDRYKDGRVNGFFIGLKQPLDWIGTRVLNTCQLLVKLWDTTWKAFDSNVEAAEVIMGDVRRAGDLVKAAAETGGTGLDATTSLVNGFNDNLKDYASYSLYDHIGGLFS